jgi:hypothetical protein
VSAGAVAPRKPDPGAPASAVSNGPPRAQDGSITAVGWRPTASLDYRDWVLEGRRIGLMWRGSPWWIGDWLLYGTARWGEMYVQAAKVTGYDPKSLRNMRYVASRFDLSLRRDNLTWSHHALVASLEREAQGYWLERAVNDRLSVEDLRLELRADRRGGLDSSPPRRPLSAAASVGTISCPTCGNPVPVPAGVLA